MEEGNSSPLNAESIRSPMNATSPVSMVVGTPEPQTVFPIPVFPLDGPPVKSESKKKKASVPGSASKKSKTSEGTPSKSPSASKAKDGESTTKPTTEKKKSGSSSAAKKKKIETLMALETEILANLEKLKKDRSKIQSKVKATDEATMKYPVKDELLFDPKNVRGKSRKTLPLPSMHVEQYISDDIANDTIFVWDFLNVFSKQLSLHEISLEDFTALMKFTGHDSVALTEIFCALLKLILNDSKLLDKLNMSIPRKVNFAYRSTSTGPDVTTMPTAADLEEQDELSIEQLTNLETFDNAYNGFKLLPRKLRADHVDLLRFQSILRCVLLRLEPVKRMRSSVSDITAALQSQYGISSYGSAFLLASTVKRINNIQSSSANVIPQKNASSSSSSAAATAKTPMSVKFSQLIHKIDTPAPRAHSKTAAAASAAKRELSAEAMTRINTPHKGPNKKPVTLDKDAIFRITADITAPLETIIEAATALETNELFMLSAKHKVAILKVLCDACYDTSRIAQLLENHAEERANRILALNKQNRDAKQKQKELNMSKRDRALELCRAANKAAAIAKLTVTTSSGRKSLGGSGAAAAASKVGSAEKAESTSGSTATAGGAAAAKKSSGGKKDPLEPSMEQLNNMIDELVLLETLGIDEVVDDLQPEVISDSEPEEGAGDDEEEYVVVDGDYVKSRRPRRNLAQSRVKGAEKARIREEKKYFNDTLEIAHTKINNALERNSEREIRSAIKAGEKSGLRFEKRGKVFCTQKLKQAYKLLNDLETKAEEDRVANQHERALQEYFVRTSPIGTDRFHNQYWSFVGDERLFVQVREEIPAAERTGLIPPSHSNSMEGDVLNHLYQSRPNRYRYKWSIYSSMSEYWHLWDALDDRGEREAELKAVIKARFEVEEPPTVYIQVGSEYIGRKVKRSFGNKRYVYGTVVGWLPQAGEDVALWHIVHADGDEEDLELHEVLESLVEDQPAAGAADVSSPLVKVASRSSLRTAASNNSLVDLSTPVKATGAAAAADKAVAVVDSGNSSMEIELPRMIRNNTSIVRGSLRNNSASIGVSGLKNELNKSLSQMTEVLKRLNGALSRDDRKVWENTVRLAETADDLKEPLLELEQLVRNVQKPEDKRDAEEEKKRRDEERAEMITEGWIFDSNTIEALGSKARRFFKGFGKSDGVIVGYLPANKNDGLALYHMEHNDGDVEDLEEADVFQAIQRYVDDVQEDDELEEESDNEDEEGSSSGEEEEEGDSEDDEDDRRHHAHDSESGPYTSTLWPTHEVRQRWREAVQRLHTVSELALAVHVFIEYVTMFGVIVPDEEEGAESKVVSGARVRKPATMFSPSAKNRPGSSSSSSSRGGSSSNKAGAGGSGGDLGKRIRNVVDRSHFSPEKRRKLSREATRRPISYAE